METENRYKAFIRPWDGVFQYETGIQDTKNPVWSGKGAHTLHSTYFFAKLRYNKLRRIAKKLNEIDRSSN